MPFIDTRDRDFKINIDTSRYKPVQVFVYTDFKGKVRPLKFNYINDDESVEYFNINGIRHAKDITDGISFTCMITNYGRQQVVNLVFYYQEHKWYVKV